MSVPAVRNYWHLSIKKALNCDRTLPCCGWAYPSGSDAPGTCRHPSRARRRSSPTTSRRSDLYLDAAALNLHDFYAGLERVSHHIAATIDRSVPDGSEWHRDLLRQMQVALSPIRPQVLSDETMQALDEFLRFRHVVRNIYTFAFDPERL